MAILANTIIILTGLNILLVLGLIFVYMKTLKKVKTSFTFGMLLFAILFLLQNTVAFYYYITMMPLYAMGNEWFAFTFSVSQTIAFIVLNYITWK